MGAVTYTIDQVCEMTGVSRRTVRYYVQEGLLAPPAGRGRGGYYLESQVERLREIKSLQKRGWTLSSIEKYLETSRPSPTAEIVSDDVSTHPGTEDRLSRPEGEVVTLLPEESAGEVLSPASQDTAARRIVRTTFQVAQGVEFVVDRDIEETVSRKIQEIVRIASTILSRKE